MTGPFIRVVKSASPFVTLLDVLQAMGQCPKGHALSAVKSAFRVAARRGLVTRDEMHAGIAAVRST